LKDKNLCCLRVCSSQLHAVHVLHYLQGRLNLALEEVLVMSLDPATPDSPTSSSSRPLHPPAPNLLLVWLFVLGFCCFLVLTAAAAAQHLILTAFFFMPCFSQMSACRGG
jgi:hypothetical protein